MKKDICLGIVDTLERGLGFKLANSYALVSNDTFKVYMPRIFFPVFVSLICVKKLFWAYNKFSKNLVTVQL